jgi:hypothetical protein
MFCVVIVAVRGVHLDLDLDLLIGSRVGTKAVPVP